MCGYHTSKSPANGCTEAEISLIKHIVHRSMFSPHRWFLYWICLCRLFSVLWEPHNTLYCSYTYKLSHDASCDVFCMLEPDDGNQLRCLMLGSRPKCFHGDCLACCVIKSIKPLDDNSVLSSNGFRLVSLIAHNASLYLIIALVLLLYTQVFFRVQLLAIYFSSYTRMLYHTPFIF